MQVIQEQLQQLLLNRLVDCDVEREWRTRMDRGIYSPRLDVAVGPFAIENGIQLIDEYDELFGKNIDFIKELVEVHFRNIMPQINHEELNKRIDYKIHELREFNQNPRCFIAIEIENKVSRKHLMGGAINASALGKIGIAVGFDDEKHRAFLRLCRYFYFLQSVGKPTFRTYNLLIISHNQLLNILQ